MAKKIFMIGFAMIILCLCCGVCFAAEDNSVTLGNEIMQSIDKTKESASNVVSGNWINDEENTVRAEEDNMKNDTKAMTGTSNYNTTRTSVDQTANRTINTMSTTTWMWIILVVAAIIIIAAIWYYATQNND